MFSSVQEFYPGNVCCFQEQRKVPPSNFESFSIFSIVIFAFGFPGMHWCRSTASQLEPLFPHLFSLSPLMISSDRHDSWINMQTQFGLPPPQNLYYALRFRDEQNMEITMGFCRDLDEWMMRRGDFFFLSSSDKLWLSAGKIKALLTHLLKKLRWWIYWRDLSGSEDQTGFRKLYWKSNETIAMQLYLFLT